MIKITKIACMSALLLLGNYYSAALGALSNDSLVNKNSSINTSESATSESEKYSVMYLLIFAFVTGFLVSLTPCIYPMISITLGILQTQATKSVLHNFLQTIAYVSGIATTYAIMGYLVVATSLIFGQWLASRWFIAGIALFFTYVTGSMFGFYEIYIPSFLRRRKNLQSGGSFISNFLFGMLSGTVASPCQTPALAAILGHVGRLNNPLIGFVVLFSFACGMGVLLTILGTFSGYISVMPVAGPWMEKVKQTFGFLMLATSVYIAQPLFPSFVIQGMYGAIMCAFGVYVFIQIRSFLKRS